MQLAVNILNCVVWVQKPSIKMVWITLLMLNVNVSEHRCTAGGLRMLTMANIMRVKLTVNISQLVDF